MRRPPPLTLARFVTTPENRSALAAVQEVVAGLTSPAGSLRCRFASYPLLLHGPAGTGKTHLVSALVAEVTRQRPDLTVAVLSASELGNCRLPIADCRLEEDSNPSDQSAIGNRQSAVVEDLVVVEDLQHLPARATEMLVQLIDALQAQQSMMVFTALAGPGHLPNVSARLASRLAAGLVVGLEPLSAPGRLALLQDKAQRCQLAVRADVLAWLAEHLTGGGRQLEGAIARLETLAGVVQRPLDVATVAAHFREQVEAGRPTVEHIAQRVGGYFQVEPRQLQSRRRSRQVLLPRQVGMYLARQLTGLSLEQIGAYFGGRDHSTVLHACRKVEQALSENAVLSGAVRQLHSDLT
jgi:chromosomal replication initiator protein